MQAQGLTPSTQTNAYQVWLYDSHSKRKSLGATRTDKQGNLQVVGTLPADYQKWQYIDVTSVTVTGTGSSRSVKSGASVLRGQLKLADKPVVTGTGANKATVLAQLHAASAPELQQVDGIQPDALLDPRRVGASSAGPGRRTTAASGAPSWSRRSVWSASAFRMSWPRTLVGAWLVLRPTCLGAVPDNDPDAARALMRRFYQLLRKSETASFDPRAPSNWKSSGGACIASTSTRAFRRRA